MKTTRFSPLYAVVLSAAVTFLSTTTAPAQGPVPVADNDVQKLELPAPMPLLSESQEMQMQSGPECLPIALTANVSRFTGTAIIEVMLPHDGEIAVTVADMYGNIAATLLDARVGAGRHIIIWRPKGVRPGIYFVTARMGDQVQSTRVEVFK